MARKPQFTRTKTETTFSAVLLGIEEGHPYIKDTKEIRVDFPVTGDSDKVSRAIAKQAGRNYQFGSLISITEKTYSMPLENFYENASLVSEKTFDNVEAYQDAKAKSNVEEGSEE